MKRGNKGFLEQKYGVLKQIVDQVLKNFDPSYLIEEISNLDELEEFNEENQDRIKDIIIVFKSYRAFKPKYDQ